MPRTPPSVWPRIEALLDRVEKPAQYAGGEVNEVRKDPRSVEVRVALAFPDTYAIGMSHLGLRILYGILNERPDCYAERAFAPWVDLETELRAAGVPLSSLETHTPLRAFDLLGFSLSYELSNTNLLNMLDLAGIPLLRTERAEDDPLVLAGGDGAASPEPMADFVDLFLIGDGETEVLWSAASSWELAVKQQLGRVRLPGSLSFYLPERLAEQGISLLPLENAHALKVADLPAHHADPFDRLLLAQAMVEEVGIVSNDRQLLPYGVPILW